MHIHETQVQKRNGAHRGEKKQFTSVREKEKEKKNIKEKKKGKENTWSGEGARMPYATI